jgi:hypothetical protein
MYHASTPLSKLTTHSTGSELCGVAVSKEATGVSDDLLDMEAGSIVDALGVVGADKEWSCQAAVRDTAVVWALGIGEGKTRRSRLALGSFVDVGCCGGRTLIIAGYARQCNVLQRLVVSCLVRDQ